jgi:FAD synthase
MKQYWTLVFVSETEEQLQAIRQAAQKESCRAWSKDHEITRTDLLRQAIEDGDLEKAKEYIDSPDIMSLKHELRG